MTKQYDTQEQIDAFNIYVKQNPAGRQVHHNTGTLGYDDDEWKAFQEGWNAALAKPEQEPVAWISKHDLFRVSVCSPTSEDDKEVAPGQRLTRVTLSTDNHSFFGEQPLYTTPPRAVKTYHEGKPVYVASHPRTFDDYGNKIV